MHGRRKGKPRFSGASPGDASVLIFLAKQHAKYCAVKRICGEKPPAQCHRGIKDCGLNPLCNIPCNKAVAAKPVMGHVHIHVPSRQTVENCAVSKRGGFGYRKVQRLSGLTFHRHRIQRQSHGRIQTTRRHPVAHQEDRFAVHLRLRGLGSGCLCGYIFNIWKNIYQCHVRGRFICQFFGGKGLGKHARRINTKRPGGTESCTARFAVGADDGNRTHIASLGSWSFATKLHPHNVIYYNCPL